jgi:hypothetical protein
VMSCDELRANQSEKVGQYIYLTNRVRGDSTVFDILQFLHMLASNKNKLVRVTGRRGVASSLDIKYRPIPNNGLIPGLFQEFLNP